MEPGKLADWDFFESAAIDLVRKGAYKEHGCQLLLQFLRLHSFNTVTGWHILRDNRGQRFVLGKTEWHRRDDFERFQKYQTFEPKVARFRLFEAMQPSMTSGLIDLASPQVESLLSSLRQCQVCPIPTVVKIGTDGTGYELAFGGWFCAAWFRWWEEPPAEWSAMAGLVIQFIKQQDPERERAQPCP